MPKCAECGKQMKNAFAMKIHVGRMHKTKGGAPKAPLVAERVAAPATPAGLDVRALAIDELIALRQQVDHRLADLAERLTLAGFMGTKPGRKPGKKPKAPAAKAARTGKAQEATGKPLVQYIHEVLAATGKGLNLKEIEARVLAAGYLTTAESIYKPILKVLSKGGFRKVERGVYAVASPVAKAAAVKKGVYSESATEMILGLLAGGKPVSTIELAAAWKKAGRKGKPSKTLSEMVKAKKLKREVLKGIKANNYTLA